MKTQEKLAQGIKAAKQGDRITAQNLLYDVVEADPHNEAAWVWLSYLAGTIADRKICLENVLVINPANDYALRGMAQITKFTNPQTDTSPPVVRQLPGRPLPLMLVTAFWSGLGVLFFGAGVKEIIARIGDVLTSRNFPYYITPLQLWTLTIAISFLILGIIALNVAWGLYAKSKIGYYVSILLSLGLTLLAPTALLIAETFNYFYVAISGVVPVLVLFLTLMSQSGLDHDRTVSVNPERN